MLCFFVNIILSCPCFIVEGGNRLSRDSIRFQRTRFPLDCICFSRKQRCNSDIFDHTDLSGIKHSLSVYVPPSALLCLDLSLIISHTYMIHSQNTHWPWVRLLAANCDTCHSGSVQCKTVEMYKMQTYVFIHMTVKFRCLIDWVFEDWIMRNEMKPHLVSCHKKQKNKHVQCTWEEWRLKRAVSGSVFDCPHAWRISYSSSLITLIGLGLCDNMSSLGLLINLIWLSCFDLANASHHNLDPKLYNITDVTILPEIRRTRVLQPRRKKTSRLMHIAKQKVDPCTLLQAKKKT